MTGTRQGVAMTARDPLVDVHAHFLTEHYVAAARATGGQGGPDGMPEWPSWDAATHLELMDA